VREGTILTGTLLLRCIHSGSNQTIVSAGGSFADPVGIVIAPSGGIFVADPNTFGGASIIHVNPTSGTQTTISSGGNLASPVSMAIEVNGNILVADHISTLIRVDPMLPDDGLG